MSTHDLVQHSNSIYGKLGGPVLARNPCTFHFWALDSALFCPSRNWVKAITLME